MTAEEDTSYQKTQAEAYCNHVRGLLHREKTARDNLEEVEASLDGLGAVRYDREGGKTYVAHGDDAMSRAITRRIELRDRYADAISQLNVEAREFDAAISNITPLYADVLNMRYRLGMAWAEVAESVNMTENYTMGLLKEKALTELYAYLPRGWK